MAAAIGARRTLAGPYEPPLASATGRLAPHASEHVVGPFAPDWPAHHVEPLWLALGDVRPDARRGRRSARRARPGSATRPDIGYEEWCGGLAVRPLAVPPAPAEEESTAYTSERGAPPSESVVELRGRAADQIESVARRVRSGELRPLGLTSTMTEAGALAAALAALLTPAT